MKKEEKKIKQSPKLPAEQRREQLLKAASRLFEKQGFDATSTDQIARDAGLTKGALYFHFKNKEEVLEELVRQIAGAFLEAFREHIHGDLTVVEVLDALNQIHSSRNIPKLGRSLDFRAQVSQIPSLQRIINTHIKAGIEQVALALDETYGKDIESRRQVATLVFCLWDGLTIRQILSPSLIDFEGLINAFDKITKPDKPKRKCCILKPGFSRKQKAK